MSDQEVLQKIKKEPFHTNCFILEDSLFSNNKCVFDSNHVKGLFYFFKDSNHNFKHLNFFLNETQITKPEKIDWNEESFVTEIITHKIKTNQSLKNWLLYQDNFHYRTFFRMLRTDIAKPNLDYAQVEHPKEKDFQNIILILEKTFDIYTERLPDYKKLKKLQQSSYVIKENNNIAAILITELKGVNQELYFMTTLPEYEGKGYGRILMNYIFHTPMIKRWIIWVDESNDRVIEWYYNMGYKKDKLVNNIYINKNIMNDKIVKILEDTRDEFNFNDPFVHFTEAGYLDSFDIISIVDDLETTFNIKISGAHILPENFKSIDAIANLVQMSKDASKV